MEGEVSFESQAGLHRDGMAPCARLRILRTALWSRGRAVSQSVLYSDLHFTEIPPAAVGGLCCSCPYFYVCLGHPPGTLRCGAHVAHGLNVSGQL